MKKVSANKVIEQFDFKLEFDNADVNRKILSPSIHRMGIELSGGKVIGLSQNIIG